MKIQVCFFFVCAKKQLILVWLKTTLPLMIFFFKEKITGVFFCHWGSTFSGASFCPFNMYLSIGNADYSIVFLIKMIEGTQKGP